MKTGVRKNEAFIFFSPKFHSLARPIVSLPPKKTAATKASDTNVMQIPAQKLVSYCSHLLFSLV